MDPKSITRYQASIEQRMGSLPLLPAVASRLLAMDPEDPGYLDAVHKLARQDPTLSVRLVEYATRTIVYEHARERLDLRHAIARLGANKVAALVLALSLVEAFEPRTKADRDLWVHSVEVAVIARHLAAMMPDLGLNPEQLYLGGLLHDIGRFIVFQAVPEGPALVDEMGWSDPTGLIAAELSLFGTAHDVVGAQACSQWGIPESLVEIIAGHHRYDLSRVNSGGQRLLHQICLVQLADAFSICLMQRCTVEPGFDPESERGDLEEVIQGLIDRFVDMRFGLISLEYRMTVPRRLAREVGRILAEAGTILNGLGIDCSEACTAPVSAEDSRR